MIAQLIIIITTVIANALHAFLGSRHWLSALQALPYSVLTLILM